VGVGLLVTSTAGGRKETGVPPEGAANGTKEEAIRRYYSGWEKKEWSAIDSVLADDFTFTSPNDDDHIKKAAFKARCWSQAEYIRRFELENVVGKGNEAFVRYLCHTTNGRSFRNTEYFRFKDGKVEAIECYFGERDSFPSAASQGRS
jgi:hypothetical protein